MVVFIAGAVAFLLGLFPIVHHLCFGLRERRREILGLLDDTAISLYFDQFYHAEAASLKLNPRVELGRIYDQRFGHRTYVLPVILYTVVLAVVVSVICVAVGAKVPPDLMGVPVTSTGAYALAGAYLWVVNDLISRYRLRNLVPSSIYAATFRIVIAIPLATAITVIFKNDFGAPIGFLLGVFPTNTLFLVVRRQVGQRFGLGDDKLSHQHELETLQGVNTSIAETFADIGITTLLQLAYEDPIQLTMRANLSFYFVLDLVSEALVAIYIDPAIARRYSIRESVDATSLNEQFQKGESNAKQVITALAGDLKTPEGIVVMVLDQISGDPCSKFIVAIWNRT